MVDNEEMKSSEQYFGSDGQDESAQKKLNDKKTVQHPDASNCQHPVVRWDGRENVCVTCGKPIGPK